ncbi:hypothetical protein C0J08_15125 [Marinomonas sp. CT5]|uniref:hypothetical protein n=1 Tax=Marinomonas sp. CT5 TaxID=2066133 RepID=UPI001BAE90A9|nr:hypothetical protein [Marinomonas sp. CT5]QUX96648.1 hypothetical protein C0J08_15125 [Marinomonas sp. CT5]
MNNGIYQDQNRYPQNTAQQNHSNPFNQAPPQPQNESANTGSIAIEQQRAIAEARSQIQLAKMFPRSNSEALSELIEACKNWDFAKSAFYSVPNRGSGPSIRFAEEVARCYGNFEYGHRELSRSKGKSEIEVYAWDKEKNNYSKRQITVEHVRDTRNGPKPLRDQADIDNRIANVASKQMRGRILAIVPKTLIETGIAECRKTLTGNNTQSISSKISQMVVEFAEFGVRPDQITNYIGHSVDECSVEDLTDLFGVFNAIKEGARVNEYFGGKEESQPKSTSLKSSLKAN